MNCLICNEKINIKISLKNFFKVNNNKICKNCLDNHAFKIVNEVIPINNGIINLYYLKSSLKEIKEEIYLSFFEHILLEHKKYNNYEFVLYVKKLDNLIYNFFDINIYKNIFLITQEKED